MKAIPTTKGAFTIVDDGDFLELSSFLWYLNSCGYAGRQVAGGKRRQRTLLMHRQITCAPKGVQVDHINGNKLDNRRSNLRLCTNQQNSWNRGLRKSNTSGYVGVVFDRRSQKWKAQIRKSGKSIYLRGRYDTPREAAKAYGAAARKEFGEFAKSNLED